MPPLVAEAVGDEVRAFLAGADRPPRSVRPLTPSRAVDREPRHAARADFPTDTRDAVQRLLLLSRVTRRELRALPAAEFRRGWHALIWLYPDLHPDNALDHGDDVLETTALAPEARDWRERYARSGWPVAFSRN